MRITRLGPPVPLLTFGLGSTTNIPPGGSAGQVPTSNGSNGVVWGENIARITANGSNALLGPYVNVAAGTGTILSVSSNTLTVAATGGGSADVSNLLTKNEGGGDTIKAHGAMGATETFDPTDGNIHTGTLDANCTVTISAPVGSGGATLEGWFTQNGTGGWTLTFAATGGTFQWDGSTPTLPTTAGTVFRVVLERLPGTTNDWVGVLVGPAAGSSLTIKDEGSSLATAATSIDFVGSGVVASGTGAAKTVTISSGSATAAAISALGFVGPILIADVHSSPLVFADLLQNDDLTDLLYADL